MRAHAIVRFTGRVVVLATILVFATIVAVQYAHVVERNVALAHTLSSVNGDIETLKSQREERLARIHRLEDPHGAIPEIHDRLHLLLPGESLIFIKGGSPAPEATP